MLTKANPVSKAGRTQGSTLQAELPAGTWALQVGTQGGNLVIRLAMTAAPDHFDQVMKSVRSAFTTAG